MQPTHDISHDNTEETFMIYFKVFILFSFFPFNIIITVTITILLLLPL